MPNSFKEMAWDTLLNRDRYGVSKQRRNRHRSEFEEDFDNIVFSTAFRRLQGKAQVFSLSGSDYVRTRLTHSFEVASVGRSLGKMVENKCVEGQIENSSNYGTIVAAACLAHDIGNPPFGHSGESAIRQWFNESKIAKRLNLTKSQKLDIKNYEGNAQGFRILTRLQGKGSGLKLTYATLAAMSKYPHCSKVDPKFGFFESEQQVFAEVAKKVGLIPDKHEHHRWCRHPLAHLVEAADDVCNRIVDFEDAARLRILRYDDVIADFKNLGEALKMNLNISDDDPKNEVEIISRKLLPKLTEEIANSFVNQWDLILRGKLQKPLIKTLNTDTARVLNVISDRLKKQVFTAPEVIEIEVPAFRILDTLLETFVTANEELHDRGETKSSKRSNLMLNLVPKQFRTDPKCPSDGYSRLLNILDFVSGMTDGYAVWLYKMITGITLPYV